MRIPVFAPQSGANIVQNALQQLYQNQILQAQARYAPQQQQGIAQQQTGLGQQEMAAGQYAPQYQQGLANIQTGIGQQEMAAGQYAIPLAAATTQQQQQAATQAGLTTQQMQALTKLYPQMTIQDLMQMIAQTRIQQANAKVAPQQAQANVVNSLTPALGTVVAHPGAAAVIGPVTSNVLGAIKNTAAGLAQGSGSVLTGPANGNPSTKIAVGTRRSFKNKDGSTGYATYNGNGWNISQ